MLKNLKLQKSLLSIALAIMFSTVFACDITAKQIVGAYQNHKGNSYLEVFELYADKTFDTWLHHRPESKGIWSLSQCSIVMKTTTYPTPITMRLISLNDKHLVVKFEDETESTSFEKID